MQKTIFTLDVNHPLGEFILKENELFFKVLEYEILEDTWITESYQNYVDIQIILAEEEIIKVYDSNTTSVKMEYDSSNDCAFYNIVDQDYISEIILKRGFFCVFSTRNTTDTNST